MGVIRAISGIHYQDYGTGPTRMYKRAKIVCYWYEIAIYELEAHGNQKPTWRKVRSIELKHGPTRLWADFNIESWKNKIDLQDAPGYRDTVDDNLRGIPWIDGIYANKPIDKGEAVKLFNECKKMPLPYCLDYIRDKADE